MNKIIAVFLVALCMTVCVTAYSDGVQADLQDNLIRLHIIADSDDDNDQAVKLKVRDAILKNVGDRLSKTDKNECRDEIINEDNSVDDPRRYRCCCAVKTKDLCCRNIARCVDEHRANQEQQQAAEDLVDGVDALVGIFADHVRHLGAAVAQADHAGEIVVHRSADDVADRDRDERDRSEKDPLDRPQDRAGTGDVEQIDEAVFPAAHRYVVDAVLLCVRRRLAIVRTEDVLAELSVDRSAYEKDHEPNDECSHK